jgi:hypothetical protein
LEGTPGRDPLKRELYKGNDGDPLDGTHVGDHLEGHLEGNMESKDGSGIMG